MEQKTVGEIRDQRDAEVRAVLFDRNWIEVKGNENDVAAAAIVIADYYGDISRTREYHQALTRLIEDGQVDVTRGETTHFYLSRYGLHMRRIDAGAYKVSYLKRSKGGYYAHVAKGAEMTRWVIIVEPHTGTGKVGTTSHWTARFGANPDRVSRQGDTRKAAVEMVLRGMREV